MTKAQEYRLYAAEAIAWAKKAKDDEQRSAFLRLAETWFVAAAYHEQSTAADQIQLAVQTCSYPEASGR